jgi:hypothetical protein
MIFDSSLQIFFPNISQEDGKSIGALVRKINKNIVFSVGVDAA